MVIRSVRRLFWAAAGIAVVGLAACGSSSSTAKSPVPSTAKPGGTTSTTTAASAGSTAWADVTAEWKSRAPRPFAAGPDVVAEDLAAAWRGGGTSEVGQISVVSARAGEPLVVVLREAGGADAAVASTDVEITLEGGDEGWAVVSARARQTCAGPVDPADPTKCG